MLVDAVEALGTIFERNLAWGANTPWNRIKFKRGRGTKAAKRTVVIRGFEFVDDLSGLVEL